MPASDDAYQDARPDLAYQPDEVLDLGEGLGLNPGMKGLKGLWDDEKLAVVRGVGYPKPDHSHFRSMGIWQTASPETPMPTGWLGRWLDATDGDPLHALAIDPVLPPLFAGEKTAAASLPAGGLVLPKGDLGTAFAALGAPSDGEERWQAAAARSIADLHNAAKTLGGAVHGPDGEDEEQDEERDKGASAGGNSGLAAQLDVVARLIEAGRADPGVLGVARRFRHPRRRAGHPGAAAGRAGHRADPVRRAAGRPPTAASRRSCWCTRSSAAG